LSFDPAYCKYADEKGSINPYEGYLKALNKYHRVPVIVSSFGIPASRGTSNIDEIRGFNEGGMDEKEQGRMLQVLYEDIMNSGLSGGFIDSWSDDWGQKAWNTEDAADTERRAFWSNAETSTQSYGLLAFEPGEGSSLCYVDGDVSEWGNAAAAAEKDGYKLQMMYDEKYMYFHVRLDKEYTTGDRVYIPLDITPNSGAKLDASNGLSYDRDMDFVIAIDGTDNSKVLVQEYYNSLYPLYKLETGKESIYTDMPGKDAGEFSIIKQLSRKSMDDGNGKKRDAVFKNSGLLHYGNSNPSGDNYDSLADFVISGSHIEIRIPWALLNFSDPSRMMIHDDYYKNHGIKFMSINELYGALAVRTASGTVQIPSGRLELKGWGDSPKWHTRLKKSYYDVQAIFDRYKSIGGSN
jgi:hypothetical protein